MLLHGVDKGGISFGVGVTDVEAMLTGSGVREGDMLRWDLRGFELLRTGERVELMITPIRHAAPGILRDIPGLEAIERMEAMLLHRGNTSGLSPLISAAREIANPMNQSAPKPDPSWNLFCCAGLKPLKSLFISLAAGGSDIEGVLMRLLGLGPGLTPSMDDLLAGIACVYVRRRDAPGREAFLSALARLAPEATSAISAAYITAAARGETFTAPHVAITEIASGNPVQAIDRLLSIGASSGGDMMTGILLAFRFIGYMQA
jgi:hypothetical protein